MCVCGREERIPMPELSPETNGEKRERWKKRTPHSLVVGVAYIECATPSPLMLHGCNAHDAAISPTCRGTT